MNSTERTARAFLTPLPAGGLRVEGLGRRCIHSAPAVVAAVVELLTEIERKSR